MIRGTVRGTKHTIIQCGENRDRSSILFAIASLKGKSILKKVDQPKRPDRVSNAWVVSRDSVGDCEVKNGLIFLSSMFDVPAPGQCGCSFVCFRA